MQWSNQRDLFNQCINSLKNELIQTKHDIQSLQKEKEAYEKVIAKLEKCRDELNG